MLHKVAGPFDLIFQDGDKRQYGSMLDALVGLLRPAGLLVTDNVLWNGEIVPGFSVERRHGDPADGAAIVKYNEAINSHPSLVTSIVPLRDGVAISAKR
jgi:caffeoyl-CoA O-methyltransferase